MIQRIGYAVVSVKNWDEAMHFYADLLGIEVVRRLDDEGVAEFRFPAGGPYLMIEQVDKSDVAAQELVGHFVGLSITVRDIEQAYRDLSARGVRFDGAPERQSWGGVLTHFFDPDGNMWSMIEEAEG